MRASLFFSGFVAGGLFYNWQRRAGNSSFLPQLPWLRQSDGDDDAPAYMLGNAPRPAQDIDVFQRSQAAWYQGKKRPFSARYRNYILGDIINLTHDVALFRFLLPNEDDEFHLKPCSTLQARVQYSGNAADTIERFYTPVTPNGSKGYFDLIVKRKPDGLMTNALFGLRIGDPMQFRNVMFKLSYKPNRWDEVGMICGGTGFTPMLQVIRHALRPAVDPFEALAAAEGSNSTDSSNSATSSDNAATDAQIETAAAAAAADSVPAASPVDVAPLSMPSPMPSPTPEPAVLVPSETPAVANAAAAAAAEEAAVMAAAPARKKPKAPEPDRTKLSLLFCNRTENHILLRHVFEQLADEFPDRFRVKFCVDRAVNPAAWRGYTGYVTEEMIRDTMPPPDRARSIILLCGPDHLLHHVAGTSYYALHTLSSGKRVQPAGVDLANLTTVEGLLGKMGYCKQVVSDQSKVCDVYKF